MALYYIGEITSVGKKWITVKDSYYIICAFSFLKIQMFHNKVFHRKDLNFIKINKRKTRLFKTLYIARYLIAEEKYYFKGSSSTIDYLLYNEYHLKELENI